MWLLGVLLGGVLGCSGWLLGVARVFLGGARVFARWVARVFWVVARLVAIRGVLGGC